jgi:hypothetical protein
MMQESNTHHAKAINNRKSFKEATTKSATATKAKAPTTSSKGTISTACYETNYAGSRLCYWAIDQRSIDYYQCCIVSHSTPRAYNEGSYDREFRGHNNTYKPWFKPVISLAS